MENPTPKKPFQDPKLVTYGDVLQVTRNVGKVGANDLGGHGAHAKTR